MNNVCKQLLMVVLVFQSAILFAQDITITANTDEAAPSPLIAGAKNVVVFGITLDKANDPTTSSVTTIVVNLTQNPTGRYLNARLYRSNDAAFDGVTVETVAATGTFGASSITFTAAPLLLTNFGNNTAQTLRHFFMVVDVDPTVTPATAPIQATVTQAEITATSTVLAGSVSGTNYSFAGSTATLAQLTTGVALNPLGAGTTDQAVLGFSLTSNGNPDFSEITIATSSDPGGKITNIRLFSSSNNSFGGGDASIATASSVTASTIVFTGLSEELSGVASNFFIVADIEPTVSGATPKLELSFDEGDVDVSVGIVQALTITGTDYDFADVTPPAITGLTPSDNATGIIVGLNSLQITFDENVIFVGDNSDDDNRIRIRDLDASTFIETIALANISVAGNVVTITFTSSLSAGTDYAIRIGNSVFEDGVGNDFGGVTNDTDWNFETEAGPTIISYSADPTCVGETITINGTNFGAAVPTVTVNGQNATVNSHTSTSIEIIVPNTVSGLVVVLNNTNGLNDSDNTLTLKPAIVLSLPISSNPSSPAVGEDYDIEVDNTQNGVNYAIRELPGGFGGTTAGTGSTISFGVFNQGTDGTYQYEVRATSAGCTQKLYTPLSVIIAELIADAGTDKIICAGDSVILGGNPTAEGGTGFFSVKWYRLPSNTLVSSSSNPVLRPNSTTSFRVVVNDSPTSSNADTVVVTVNIPTNPSLLDIVLTPDKPNNTYQKEETDPVILSYKIGASVGTYSGSTHFEGPGVNSNGGIKYFYPNAANVGGNQIDLYYENPQGCITKDSIFVFIRDKNLFVSGLNEQYCRENSTESLIVNSPIVVPPFGFTFCFFGPCTDYTFVQGRRYTYTNRTRLQNSPTPNDSISDPSIFSYSGINLNLNTDDLVQGTKQFEIYYSVELLNYSSSPPGYVVAPIAPFAEVVTVPFDVIDKPVVFESMMDFVCENEPAFILDVFPIGGNFTLNGSPSTNTFNPATVGLPNSNNVVYTYTDPNTTCSNSVSNTITINRLPTINDLDFNNGCVGDTINFTPEFTNNSNISFKYGWDVDGFDGIDINIPNNVPVTSKRFYSVASNYPIKLQLITDAGCIEDRAETLTIGQVPDLKIAWANVCDGDNTRFAIKSNFFKNSLGDVDSIKWDYGDGTFFKKKSPVFADSVIQHLYTTTDYFPSTVTIVTDLSCKKTDSVLVFKVSKTAAIGVNEYMEDFNDAAFETQAWKSGGTNTSWDWGNPLGTLINDDSSPGGGKAWVTNLSGTYNGNEDSWVHSPCFNLTQIQRPVLSFDYRSLTREGVDGAVLQYNSKNSTNKESDWKTLGTVGSGKNWYNKIAIGANPGNQNLLQTGWTGLIDSSQWRTAIIPLDNIISSIPLSERTQVRLRFAFASSDFTPDAEGFAFDNFKISQRDRLVLLEQFTNNGGANIANEPNKVANQTINTFLENSSGEAIKLEYHLGLDGPNEDPIYLDNPTDANARAAYYGITSTPFTLIDARHGNFSNIFAEQTLETAAVSIDTIITANTPSDKLNIEVRFTARQNISQNSVLHIAVVEKEVFDLEARGTNGELFFKYVVKKLLPDATGTVYTSAILDGTSQAVNVSWSPEAYILDSLAIIAFVQNQDTKVIYQARLLETPTYIPDESLITETEPLLANKIYVYPNPAKDEINIELPKSYPKSLPVKVIDAFGREVHTSDFNIGEQKKTLKTSEFPSGVYIIQIKTASGEMVRKKVIIAN